MFPNPELSLVINSTIIKRKFFVLLLVFTIALPTKLRGQELVVDLNEVKSLVDRWAEAHNDKDFSFFRKMYSAEVVFYGETLPKSTCMDIKTKSLRAARQS